MAQNRCYGCLPETDVLDALVIIAGAFAVGGAAGWTAAIVAFPTLKQLLWTVTEILDGFEPIF